ncbi:MAG: hypothetical protein IPK10_12215 [Bacteroidetes bacterium]|nr:hypothetical protein [Bacteroidota bacterium]
MPKFAVRDIEGIQSKERGLELIIDGIGQLSEFESELEECYKSEFAKILGFIESSLDRKLLPATKFKILKSKDNCKEYEFKTKHLRVYAIKTIDGKLICFCGFKNSQSRDINKFRAIKKRYLESLLS